MIKWPLALAAALLLTPASLHVSVAQDTPAPPQSAKQALQAIHTPASIDQELDRLTRDLELSPPQRMQIRPLLEKHHDRIQTLLDKNPNATRQSLAPQIHAISDQTHHEINALLNDHQMQLVRAMREREDNGQESRRP